MLKSALLNDFVHNQYQGPAKRVLCVCETGMLRSPTMANVLHREYGYNTRAVGVNSDRSLTKMTIAHFFWADKIFIVDMKHYDSIQDLLSEQCDPEELHELKRVLLRKILWFPLSDVYDYMDEELQESIIEMHTRFTETEQL